MTDAYIYSLKAVLELGPTNQQSDTLTTLTLGTSMFIGKTWIRNQGTPTKNSGHDGVAL